MLLSLSILVYRWIRKPGGRAVTAGAIVITILGIFVSGARTPVVQLGLLIMLVTIVTRFSPRILIGFAAIATIVAYVVFTNPRFQRFMTLEDTEYVQNRIGLSLNLSFLDVLSQYPMGAGLGSGAGTSIPFFLLKYSHPQIGLENEYSRVLLEQGIIGLLLWLAFLVWVFTNFPPKFSELGWVPHRMMWASVIILWGSAFMGVGMMTSVPATFLLMLLMGSLCVARAPKLSPKRGVLPVILRSQSAIRT